MDAETKPGVDAAKTASKRVVQKTADIKLEAKQLIKLLLLANQNKNQKKKQKKFTCHQKKDNKLLTILNQLQ